MKKYVLSLDQGTTSSRAIVFDSSANIVSVVQKEFTQYYPKPGWVEHDPAEILDTQVLAAKEAIKKAGIEAQDITAIGIANQRETAIIWDKQTGKPIHHAIVWQCRRTSSICDTLNTKGLSESIRKKTGLVLDAYFSGTKIKWILENVTGAMDKAKKGGLLFGTVDTWLLWNLTGGRVHATDMTNASRTMLYNIHTHSWDLDILKELNIPSSILPEVLPSSCLFGVTKLFGAEIPITGIAGDQQAALFGQACFEEGTAKNTYGTGCFILMNTGEKPVISKNNLLTTVAWAYGNKVTYALEGSVFNAGTAIQWLRDGLGMIRTAAETEQAAASVPDTNGVFFVPAFTGLGAPYWDMYARGIITGLTRGTGKCHIIRAALESIAFQSKDVFTAMEADAGIKLTGLKADGGASLNNVLMQIQADVLGIPISRPKVFEATALGAFYLAALAMGIFKNTREISEIWQADRVYMPLLSPAEKDKKYAEWKSAVIRSFSQKTE